MLYVMFCENVIIHFFCIHIKILQYYNLHSTRRLKYCTTQQGRYHGERKATTTPWPVRKDTQYET